MITHQWEYLEVNLDLSSGAKLEGKSHKDRVRLFNELGYKGWEMCGGGSDRVFFKRPIHG